MRGIVPEGGERAVDAGAPLVARLEAHLYESGFLPAGAALTLALSGGLDSVVLLDLLLRLRPRWDWRITAAHFDHRMRPGSAEDAAWVESLCRDIGVPLIVGRAERAPEGETDAREARYAFLLDARQRLGARLLVTAHHADDQVETILFRILRGSPVEGLAGIPEIRDPWIVRPLLPFWRRELAAYAAERRLAYREDVTNRDPSYARNRLRHGLLPFLEESRPELKEALLRLGTEAEHARRRWSDWLRWIEEGLVLEREADRIVVAAPRLSEYDELTRTRLLRRWVRVLGGVPTAGAITAAGAWVASARSGGTRSLGSGIVLRREYDRWVLERADAAREGPLTIASPEPGAGDATIGGVRHRVLWGATRPEGMEHVAGFDLEALTFPVCVRARRAGDRIERAVGARSLKRLFVDRRVPRSERGRAPVVADGLGVLWVAGVERSARARPREGAAAWSIGLSRIPRPEGEGGKPPRRAVSADTTTMTSGRRTRSN